MPRARSTDHRSGSRTMTPLGIIAIFVGLAQTVAGLAAIQTVGGVQIAFTSFALAFPVLIAAAFFAMLWMRPVNFYSPKEFGPEVDVARYAEAMRQQAF